MKAMCRRGEQLDRSVCDHLFLRLRGQFGIAFGGTGVEFGDRAGNRITDVAKSGAVIGFLFDKITYQLGGSGSVGAICLDKTDRQAFRDAGLVALKANGDRVDFRWQTTTETANAGFNLYGEGPDGLIRLNDALIPSSVIDSVEPTDYAYSAVTTATVFYVEELSLEGMTDQIGPFELGQRVWRLCCGNRRRKAPQGLAADHGALGICLAVRARGRVRAPIFSCSPAQ